MTSHPRLANFHTNASISGEGFQIDQVSLCSGPGGAWGTVVVPGKRYSGLMLGTGDVIYLGVNGPPTGNVLHLPMWHPVDNLVDGSYSGANPDIDMYVQCGGFPTPTSHLRASVRLDSDEFIRISSADCPSSSMLIIAITSFQGAGQFEFMPSLAKATSTTPTTLRVLYETAAGGETTAQTNELTSMLKQFSHRLYGATDGQVLITHFDVVRKANGYFDYTYPVATTSEKDTCRSACAAATGLECDICISQDIPGAGSIGHFRHSIFSHFNLSNWASVLVHEWGHYALGINGAIGNEYCEQTPGEFTEGDGSTCGHSVMGKFDLTQNFCQPRNHGKGGDADAPDCSPAGGLSNWSAGASVLTGDPPQTADWFNFADFPFGQTSAPTHPSLPTIACHPIVPSIPCN